MANARVQLPDRTWREVKSIAARRNVTSSTVVSEALSDYLKGKQGFISTVDVKKEQTDKL
jgi:predicted transcriptional regulator